MPSPTNNPYSNLFTLQYLLPFFYGLVIFIIGFILAKILSSTLVRISAKHTSRQQQMLIKKISKYFIIIIFLAAALQQIGFNLSVLLSAAGVITVAVSFASRTAFSNIISGLFLLFEKPFKIGDTITINNISGEIVNIDLLSIKVRTFDNTLVRFANENILKTPITNLSFYETRRFDFKLGVDYKSNLSNVFLVLNDIAKNNQFALSDPEATISILGYGESSIELQFSVWSNRTDFAALKKSLQQEVKETFDKQNIIIPYPHRVIEMISEPINMD